MNPIDSTLPKRHRRHRKHKSKDREKRVTRSTTRLLNDPNAKQSKQNKRKDAISRSTSKPKTETPTISETTPTVDKPAIKLVLRLPPSSIESSFSASPFPQFSSSPKPFDPNSPAQTSSSTSRHHHRKERKSKHKSSKHKKHRHKHHHNHNKTTESQLNDDSMSSSLATLVNEFINSEQVSLNAAVTELDPAIEHLCNEEEVEAMEQSFEFFQPQNESTNDQMGEMSIPGSLEPISESMESQSYLDYATNQQSDDFLSNFLLPTSMIQKLDEPQASVDNHQDQKILTSTSLAPVSAYLGVNALARNESGESASAIINSVSTKTSQAKAGQVPHRRSHRKGAPRKAKSLHHLLNHLVAQFKKKDTFNFFSRPVTDDIAPGYSTLIRHPMDLSTIRRNISSRHYLTLGDFRLHLKLMLDNCMTYNGPDTVFHKTASKLWNMVEGRFFGKEALLNYRKQYTACCRVELSLEAILKPIGANDEPESNSPCANESPSEPSFISKTSPSPHDNPSPSLATDLDFLDTPTTSTSEMASISSIPSSLPVISPIFQPPTSSLNDFLPILPQSTLSPIAASIESEPHPQEESFAAPTSYFEPPPPQPNYFLPQNPLPIYSFPPLEMPNLPLISTKSKKKSKKSKKQPTLPNYESSTSEYLYPPFTSLSGGNSRVTSNEIVSDGLSASELLASVQASARRASQALKCSPSPASLSYLSKDLSSDELNLVTIGSSTNWPSCRTISLDSLYIDTGTPILDLSLSTSSETNLEEDSSNQEQTGLSPGKKAAQERLRSKERDREQCCAVFGADGLDYALSLASFCRGPKNMETLANKFFAKVTDGEIQKVKKHFTRLIQFG